MGRVITIMYAEEWGVSLVLVAWFMRILVWVMSLLEGCLVLKL